MTSFAKFESSLSVRKSYKDEWGRLPVRIKKAGVPLSKFAVVETASEAVVTGAHVMSAGHENPRSALSKAFGLQFPDDFTDFYRKWNGGYLFLAVPYNLLSIDKIVERNRELRELREIDPATPWTLIRFADIGNSDYIGYRIKDNGSWGVSLLLNEYSDDWLQGSEGKEFEAPTLAPSFSEWINRAIESDGVLPSGSPAPLERIR